MSRLRPECKDGSWAALFDDYTALRRIYKAVARRRSLAHGKLHDGEGKHCAMGCFWTDNTGSVNTWLVDQIATVNDSVPPTATPKERWDHVMKWLRWKLDL
jgi:hypothetical protein